MSVNVEAKTLSYRIWSNFSTDFDELQNIKIENRKTDIWFSDFWQMVIKMRDWTTQVWNSISWTWWVTWQFFFIDFFKKIHHLKWFDNKIFQLNWGIWNNILSFNSTDLSFNPVLLPMQLDWTIPTTHITWSDSSAWERVKKSSTDTWWTSAIWKYLIITDNSWNSQAYRGAFASILDYNTSTFEYTLNGSWITTSLKSWAKYQIYDTLWEYIQFTNGSELEKYVYWKPNWDLVENISFQWLATLGLRNIKWLSNSEFLFKQISYYWAYWNFNKNTLYYSTWTLNNPFLYNFTTVLSIPWNISGKINDLFIFKDRLIIWGDSYIAYLRWPISSWVEISLITQSYWITPKTLVDVWIDAYFFSTNKHIYSLKENLAWTAIESTDEWKIIWNYLKDFNFNLLWAFDWSKLYFYWEQTEWQTWIITVLDIQYKFWSTYTWLSPSSIINNNWKTYLSDNKTDKISFFDSNSELDISEKINQKISVKDIYLWKPFTQKALTDIYLWLDNFPQSLIISTYMSLVWKNTMKNRKIIEVWQSTIAPIFNSVWGWIIWEWLLWWASVNENAILPIMQHIRYENDKALFWKIIIEWKDWSPFYLNQLDVEVIPEITKQYFSAENTI